MSMKYTVFIMHPLAEKVNFCDKNIHEARKNISFRLFSRCRGKQKEGLPAFCGLYVSGDRGLRSLGEISLLGADHTALGALP